MDPEDPTIKLCKLCRFNSTFKSEDNVCKSCREQGEDTKKIALLSCVLVISSIVVLGIYFV